MKILPTRTVCCVGGRGMPIDSRATRCRSISPVVVSATATGALSCSHGIGGPAVMPQRFGCVGCSGTVSVIDTKSRTVTATIAFKPPGVPADKVMPVAIKFTADGKTAIVALGRANAIAFVDVASHAVTGYVTVGQRVWQLAIEPGGARLFTANGLTNDVSVVDVATRAVTATIPAGKAPWGVVIAP